MIVHLNCNCPLFTYKSIAKVQPLLEQNFRRSNSSFIQIMYAIIRKEKETYKH